MKNRNSISAIILAQLLITVSVSACGGDASVETETHDVASNVQQTDVVTEAPYNGLDAVDGGGIQFKILTHDSKINTSFMEDMIATEMTGETINDAIYERNLDIQEKYNIEFDITAGDTKSVTQKFVQAGDNGYAFVVGKTVDNIAMSAEHYFYNLAEFPHLQISKPWWNHAIIEDMSVWGQKYVAIGDLNIQAYNCAGAIYYNKTLASQYDIEDPYKLVYDGEWTFDKMSELCRNVSMDLNGNGQYDEKDQYGITYNNFAWQLMFYGMGETFVKRDSAGALYLDKDNEKITNYLQKILPSAQDVTITLYSENYKHLGGSYRTETCSNAFYDNRVLFWLEAMYGVHALRNMETDFGLLPMPKYDENQEQYYSFVHTSHSSSIVIPITVPETEFDLIGHVLEDLVWKSSTTVRPAFIETTIKGKYTRDEESIDMVDYIINGIRLDYALLLNAAGFDLDAQMRTAMNEGATSIASIFAAKSKEWDNVLSEFCASFGE